MTTSRRCRLLDGYGLLGTVLRAEPRLPFERARHLGLEDHAVPELVGSEHVRAEHVAPAVPDTQVGVHAYLHESGAYPGAGRTCREPTRTLRRDARRATTRCTGLRPRLR